MMLRTIRQLYQEWTFGASTCFLLGLGIVSFGLITGLALLLIEFASELLGWGSIDLERWTLLLAPLWAPLGVAAMVREMPRHPGEIDAEAREGRSLPHF